MPNSKGSAKRHRQSRVLRSNNRSAKSAVRSIVKDVEASIKKSDKNAATSSMLSAIKALDSAARKGLFKKNAVARKKSRLQKKINSMQ
ncbi:MAG: 30S ribosomal protein S20 [Spirochaetia bacterium]